MRDTESAVGQHGPLPFSVTQPGLAYGAWYKWSNDFKKIDVNVFVNIPDSGMEMELYTACEGVAPITHTQYSHNVGDCYDQGAGIAHA